MVQYKTRRMRQFVLMLVLLGFIPTEKAFPAEKIDWKGSEPKTGNRLAVLEFSSKGISAPIQNLLTAVSPKYPESKDVQGLRRKHDQSGRNFLSGRRDLW